MRCKSLDAQKQKWGDPVVVNDALQQDLESVSVYLELSFELEGAEKQFHIYRRPLGVEFKKRGGGPTKISNVNPDSYAKHLGLEEGMILQSVGGKDVSALTFDDIQNSLKIALMALPKSLY